MIPQQLPLGLHFAPVPRLENFLPGANGAALHALRQALTGAGPQFLHLWGPEGSGKTHLLRALRVAQGEPDAQPLPLPDPGAGDRIAVWDDVHALDEAGQARLFALQNEVRGTPGRVLVSAADAPPAALRLREDVRTRLGWGLVFQLHPIADEERADALGAHVRARGVRVDEELVPYMLSRLPRDMRTLVSVLDALDAYALERGRALTVPLLREWLQRATPVE